MSDYAKRAADAHVHASYFRKPEAIHPRGEEARNTAEVMALADERRDANKIARDLTACRSELAFIALLMQERGRLPDMGGDNFALVAGAVTEYVIAMELAVIALNEDRNDMLEQIGGLTNLLACDDDCHHAPMCVRWEHGDDVFDDDYHNTLRDETGASWPNDPNIT